MSRRLGILIAAIIIIGAGSYFWYHKSAATATNQTTSEETKLASEKIDNSSQNTPTYLDTDVNKEWVISFDESLDLKTINSKNIEVFDKNHKVVPVHLELKNQGQSISIQPPKGGYRKGEQYTVQMSKALRYKDGEKVKNSFTFSFVTKREEVKDVVYNPNIHKLKASDVLKASTNTLLLKKTATTSNLKKDDILTVPHEKDVIKEVAVKVKSVGEQDGKVLLEVTQPKFEELFDSVDLYQTYTLASKDLIVKPVKGVTYEKLQAQAADTQIASSNTKESHGEFQVEDVFDAELKEENGELSFAVNKLKVSKYFSIRGHVNLKDPKVITDIRKNKRDDKFSRYNMEIKTAEEVQLSMVAEKNFENTISSEKLKKALEKTRDKTIATVYYPTPVPGLYVTGDIQIGGMLFGNEIKKTNTKKIDINDKTTVKAEVYGSADSIQHAGVIKTSKGYKPYINSTGNVSYGFKGRGHIEAEVEPKIGAGVSALGVLGVGVETGVGIKSQVEAIGEVNFDGDDYDPVKKVDINACAKASYYPFASVGVEVGMMKDIVIYNPELEVPLTEEKEISTCQQLKKIEAFPKEIVAKPGDTIDMKYMPATYYDIETSHEVQENLLEDKEATSSMKITTENKKVANVFFTKSKKGDQPTFKIKIPKHPEGNTTVVTVMVLKGNKHLQVKIPVAIKEANTVIHKSKNSEQEQEAKHASKDKAEVAPKITGKGVTNIYRDIIGVLGDLQLEHQWDTAASPLSTKEVAMIQQKLEPYATEKFIEQQLTPAFNFFFSSADSIGIPDNLYDNIRLKVLSQSSKRIKVQTIMLSNDTTNRGGYLTFTAVVENGKWKLDGYAVIDADRKPLNLTWNEIVKINKSPSYESSSGYRIKRIGEATREWGEGETKKVMMYEVLNPESESERYKEIYLDDGFITFTSPEDQPSPDNKPLNDEISEANTEDTEEKQATKQKDSEPRTGWNGTFLNAANTQSITITNASDEGFDFALRAYYQQNTGDIEGKAHFMSEGKASYDDSGDEFSVGCQVQFQKQSDSTVVVDSNAACNQLGGLNVSFGHEELNKK
ncbi:Ig-like domain-containing protein [Priestia sp. D3YE.R1]|uniref:Ig-like domain-containing protein n=1 Tax=Priestia sp. D3YE.R1 TaxID=3400416 RepID=UPI003B9FAE47